MKKAVLFLFIKVKMAIIIIKLYISVNKLKETSMSRS